MRRYATQAEIDCIPNVNYKRNHITHYTVIIRIYKGT